MLFYAYFHRPSLSRDDSVLTGKKAQRAIKKVQRDLRIKLENGQPFFTKDAIRDVRDQLRQSTKKGHKITIRGLDDMPVEFVLATGDICPRIIDDSSDDNNEDDENGENGDIKHVLTNPCIRYRTLQALLDYPKPLIDMHSAYCNMQIAHHSVLKNTLTGKILDGSDALPPSKSSAQRLFEQNLRTWKDGQQCQSLISILKSKQECFKKEGVSNIISFGSGTFTGNVRSDWKTHSAFQHALLLTLRDFLREVLGDTNETKILAQDPAYVQRDKDILTEQGITFLEDPDGFLELDDRSIVVSCAPAAPIKQIVTDLCRPLMLIGDTVRPKDDMEVKMCDPDTPRIRDLIRNHYDIFDFPQDPDNLGHEDNFGHVSIYVRRE